MNSTHLSTSPVACPAFLALLRELQAHLAIPESLESDKVQMNNVLTDFAAFEFEQEYFHAIAASQEHFSVYCEVDAFPVAEAPAAASLRGLLEMNLELAQRRCGALGIEAETDRLVHLRFFSVSTTTLPDLLIALGEMADVGRQARGRLTPASPQSSSTCASALLQTV